MLTIYNSLTKRLEKFTPLHKGLVGLYHCGPTAYDHVHIGNLRSYIFADVLQRTLKLIEDLEVKWVMNITDIDDKMIARAREEYPDDDPKLALGKLADRNTDAYLDDLEAVGINRSDIAKLPRATDHIVQMQELISGLVREGIAYQSRGSFYFSLEKYQMSGKRYGVLTSVAFHGQPRVIDDQDQKEGVGDFALWKATRAGEPSWNFELDGKHYPGRPGWHIECSAMSQAYLKKPFDIHTGGVDLKFPHHENEIAQSGGELARYFMHNEFLNIEQTKMSKSRGNFVQLSDVGDGLVFRLLCLGAHYRKQMDFTQAGLRAACNRLNTLREFASKCANNSVHDSNDARELFQKAFAAAMEDDLNTPEALAALAELERTASPNQQNLDVLLWADGVLGLQLERDLLIIDSKVKELLHERSTAREAKNFRLSDGIRDRLRHSGVGVEDTPEGQITWRLAE